MTKLNLGSGLYPREGYENLDFDNGDAVYPLQYADGSIDEVYASHILEHFGHHGVPQVVAEWARVLKPGGLLKIAVPDFDKIVEYYKANRDDLDLQGYLMGGQVDCHDFHKSIFNEQTLRHHLEEAGLTDIERWTTDSDDSSGLEISLNLQGRKPNECRSLDGDSVRGSDYPSVNPPRDTSEAPRPTAGSMDEGRSPRANPSVPRAIGWPQSEASNIYSQYGEDGILKAIFDKIGAESRFCVDVGAADGLLFSNVRQFIEQGWTGLLIEGDELRWRKLVDDPALSHCRAVLRRVAPVGLNSLDSILREPSSVEAPREFDLLSIDIDGQDFYIWNSLLNYRPRVVVCEYSPEVDPMFIPPLNGEGQAGWNAIAYVAAARGYICVAKTQTNVIALRRDIAEKLGPLKIVEEGDRPRLEQRRIEMIESVKPVRTHAVLSVPRLGFNSFWNSMVAMLVSLHIDHTMIEGAFWHQCLTRGIEIALASGAEQILVVDYDSIFEAKHVVKLIQLLADQTDYDIIVPRQTKREHNQLLAQLNGDRNFAKPLTAIAAGHFGLTLFDRNVFAKMPKPWFLDVPSPQGDWGEGRVDSDMFFWKQVEKAGIKVGLANQVTIGHLELQIAWPTDRNVKVFQPMQDYRDHGQPGECGGGLKVKLSDRML